MKTPTMALAALAAPTLLAGCNPPEDSPTTPDTSATPDETAVVGGSDATAADDAPSAGGAGDRSAADTASAPSDRITVSGTVDRLVLETYPPFAVLTGADGTKYIANIAPAAGDSVVDTIEGAGWKAALDCKPEAAPEHAEPGYSWLGDCNLAG